MTTTPFDPNADVARTEPLDPTHWPAALADFSRTHHGWLVRVLQVPTAATAAPADEHLAEADQLAADVTLAEVAVATDGARVGLDIRVRNDVVHTATHIERPRSIALERGADGGVMGLRIDDTGGRTTLVRFRSVLPTEMLDGLADGEL
ncbi:hypothetical protein [Thiohalocapsa sp. ML1]|jgi:hypothetical protein|uniref:hypothetical protein n=1 Tax=Thiohalocapsa sp. ML1 TaxID=1431688 RepID=UPI000731F1F9|nr:hypothetical protein [Thiohalocapsa sp. ML1]